jgi:D-glycero-alpha-D-manno-heptose-7-phosphate kinase
VGVQACAPLRISFAGGGTDVPPYPATNGGAVLSATIGRCARAHVRARRDHDYHVESLDLMARAAFARHELVFNGHLDLVKAVLRDLAPRRGLDLTLATDAPPGSGLGSSSALVVAMLAAVGVAGGGRWSPAELARRAYQVERVDLKIEGGMQDQYAAAFGGLNFIEFHGDDDVTVRSLEVAPATVEALERSLLLAWSGRGRTDDGILRRQVDGVLGGSAQSLEPPGDQGAGRGDARRAAPRRPRCLRRRAPPGLAAEAPAGHRDRDPVAGRAVRGRSPCRRGRG